MATTLVPIDPAMSPQRVSRILTISASLLPEETIAKRRARRARLWVAAVVLVVAGLCGAWFTVAHQQTQSAEEELEQASATVRTLQADQRKYSGSVQVKNGITTLTGQLEALMTKDLDWAALLDTLRTTGSATRIQVDGVNGRLHGAEGGETSPASTLPSTNTATSIGSLVVTGSAPDKKAVAGYVDALAKQTVVANPYVTSVATDEDGVTFSLTVDITQAALCGRFTDQCKPTGGK